jgi:BMFP domain-containing protein YqiC
MSFLNQFKEKAQELQNSVQEKVEQAIQAEPLQGLHKNANALLQQGLQKMDIVTVQEFQIQQELLSQALIRIQHLEERIAVLENAKNTD